MSVPEPAMRGVTSSVSLSVCLSARSSVLANVMFILFDRWMIMLAKWLAAWLAEWLAGGVARL